MKRFGMIGLFACALLLTATAAPAVDSGFMGLLGPRVGQLKPRVAYDMHYWGRENVQGQNADLAMQRHEFDAMTPLWQNEANELALWLGVDVRLMDSEMMLPEVNRQMPDELWDINLAMSYRHKFGRNWIAGVRGSFGSPSDKPFTNADTLAYNGMAFARRALDEHQALLFFLVYSSDMDFLPGVPYPGVAWQYTSADRRLDLLIGVPMFMVNYRPVAPLKLSLAYYPLRNVFAQAGWDFSKTLTAFGRFTWTYQDYQLSDRPRDENRLFYYEKRAMAGLTIRPMRDVEVEVAGGWAFDREMFQGENYGDRDQGFIKIDDGWLMHVKAALRF